MKCLGLYTHPAVPFRTKPLLYCSGLCIFPVVTCSTKPLLESILTLCRGIAAGISAALSAEEIARICIDCKADVVVVQHEALLKKVDQEDVYEL